MAISYEPKASLQEIWFQIDRHFVKKKKSLGPKVSWLHSHMEVKKSWFLQQRVIRQINTTFTTLRGRNNRVTKDFPSGFPSRVHFLANLPLIQAKTQVFKKIGIYKTPSNRHNQKKTSKKRASAYHLSSITKQSFSRLSSLSFRKASNAGPPGIMTTWLENCTKKKGIKTDDGFFFLSLSLPSLSLYKAVYPSKPSLVSPRLFGSVASMYVCMYVCILKKKKGNHR